MSSEFNFRIFKPKRILADYIQAIWVVSTHETEPEPVLRYLNSDGCTGILFNLGGPIQLSENSLPCGVIAQPISTKTESIRLPANSCVVGVRFHPAIGHAIVGDNYQQATPIDPTLEHNQAFRAIYNTLKQVTQPYAKIVTTYRWLSDNLSLFRSLPRSLKQAIDAMQTSIHDEILSVNTSISQRQLERQFKKWLGITPKHFQRVMRVHHTLNSLRKFPSLPLAHIANLHGFTDQAHMTRELKQIAQITPKQYRLLSRNT